MAPAVSLALAAALLRERLAPRALRGAALMLLGFALTITAARRDADGS